ncbi:MAG: hypothetical protein JWO32_2711 [Bacteroidetes bacterium]|nr:hypothetical protein [Bacteroidota bacterium]
MKKLYILLMVVVCCSVRSQVFVGSGGVLLNNGGQETVFSLNVSGLSAMDSLFGLEEVTIDLNHAAVEEVQVYLQSPSGITVDLSGVLSCKGANFSGTSFNNNMLTSITVGTAPYSGTFVPVGNMGRFNTNMPANGTWKLFVKDFIAPANQGTLISWSLRFSNTPAKPVILTSSNLPLVFINTPNNQALSSTDLLVNFGIINNSVGRNYITDPKNDYNGKANCHIRGSSSKMFEKNNLKIELKDPTGGIDNVASLLGLPAESDWVLTAGYSDKTLIRNALTQYAFQQMGHYSPRFKYVELFINNEYFGVYLLMEQVKRGKQRVNVGKITPVDNQFPYITGGYILQINRTDNPGWFSKYPGISSNAQKFYYQYNYPNATNITPQQSNYIKQVTDSFETVMQSPAFLDPVTGYKKFIDDNSFIDFLILNELSKNVDAYRLSTYLSKDNVIDGGKLHIGPMWDYDLGWHNCNYGNAFLDQFWQFENPDDNYPTPTWWTQFMQDPAFKDKLYCRYHTIRLSFLSNNGLNSFIDQTAALLDESQKRNFRQFPILGAYIYPNPQTQAGATYVTEVNDLKQWIASRGAWMDANIPGFCNSVGFNENQVSENDINVFPNPFANSFSVQFNISEPSKVKIELLNVIGQQILMINNDEKVRGEYSQEIFTEKLKEGTYILKLDINGKVTYKKLVKF